MAYRVTRWAGAPEGAIAKAAELAKQDGWHNPDQYKNKANPASHFKTTGPEIWKQACMALFATLARVPCALQDVERAEGRASRNGRCPLSFLWRGQTCACLALPRS